MIASRTFGATGLKQTERPRNGAGDGAFRGFAFCDLRIQFFPCEAVALSGAVA